MKKKIIENIKTLLYALILALIIRSFFFQPFYIPSSSMEPNLLIPFSPKFTDKRFIAKKPIRGDVIVFKTPADNRTDYIKRLIGLPGDTIQLIDSEIFINKKEIKRKSIKITKEINCGEEPMKVNAFEEILPNGKKYIAVYRVDGTMMNTDMFVVPDNHYFFMGDNRDCSKDSRFLGSVGYVSFNNLVGKAKIIFFSNDKKKGSFIKFWRWNETLRMNRFFKRIL